MCSLEVLQRNISPGPVVAVRVEFFDTFYKAPEKAYSGLLVEERQAIGGLLAVRLATLEVPLGSWLVAHPDFSFLSDNYPESPENQCSTCSFSTNPLPSISGGEGGIDRRGLALTLLPAQFCSRAVLDSKEWEAGKTAHTRLPWRTQPENG